MQHQTFSLRSTKALPWLSVSLCISAMGAGLSSFMGEEKEYIAYFENGSIDTLS